MKKERRENQNLTYNCQKKGQKLCQNDVQKLSKSCQNVVKSCQKLSKSCQKVVKQLSQKVVTIGPSNPKLEKPASPHPVKTWNGVVKKKKRPRKRTTNEEG
jgi:uncharacterized protein YoxC